MRPVVVGGAGGDAENLGRFLKGHADEIAQLHQFGFGLVSGGELVQRVAHRQEFVIVSGRGNLEAS